MRRVGKARLAPGKLYRDWGKPLRMKDHSEPAKSKGLAGLLEAYADAAPKIRRMGARFSLDGEEVAQDACVRVLRSEARADAIEEPVNYLLRVARNLFVDRSRARIRESAVRADVPHAAVLLRDSVDPERILAGRQRLEIVLAAVKLLPPRCREAFESHRFEGLSYAVIARRMEISPSMVEKHIAEAMLRLNRALRKADEGDPGE